MLQVISRHYGGVSAVSMGRCLHALTPNPDENEFSSFFDGPVSVAFADDIEAMAWSKCGRFIAAGLANGGKVMFNVQASCRS